MIPPEKKDDASVKTVFVHGYNYNIKAGDNPERQYKYWRKFVGGNIIPFQWQSRPYAGVWGAWKTGHWNTYHWAWSAAVKAADPLAQIIRAAGPCNIVCHSLGSRVAYVAMTKEPGLVRRILTFAGADSVSHARACIKAVDGPEIFSVKTREDDVLGGLGRMFTPKIGPEWVVGYDGLKRPWPKGWNEIDLGARGDGPGYGDHDWSFVNPDFWPQWREILA